jgi:hypothetical protein
MRSAYLLGGVFMPFKGWVILCLTAILISGCATDDTNKDNKSDQNTNKDIEEITFNDSSQASDDTQLTKVNKTIEDADGAVTLKQYAKLNEEQKSDLISITVSEVKVLHYKPSVDLIDFFHGFTKREEFPYVRVNVVIKNNGKKKVHFAPVSKLTTDQGETVTWKDDFYLEKLNGEIKPGEVKVGSLGFVLEKSKPEEIKNITIQTSEVINESKKKIADPLTFKINFDQ